MRQLICITCFKYLLSFIYYVNAVLKNYVYNVILDGSKFRKLTSHCHTFFYIKILIVLNVEFIVVFALLFWEVIIHCEYIYLLSNAVSNLLVLYVSPASF